MRLRRVLSVAIGLPAVALAGFAAYLGWLAADDGRASQCRGTVANGSLTGGGRLPHSGDNYRAYSTAGFLLGRTFMHGRVAKATREAYAALYQARPELRFVYAEAGWPWGGSFAPHKTHRNGTSVDFHVPVRGSDDKVAELPTTLTNQLGYSVEFDKTGRSGTLRLDFEAMALHLQALDKAVRANGIGIERVIFDVDLQPLLFATEPGAHLRKRLAFNSRQSWVRHDEHYHVDFAVPCRG